MSWLVTGAAGQLGTEVVGLLAAQNERVTGLTRAELDITSGAVVDSVLGRIRPDVVVNCAAYTAVDAAESDEAAAMRINRDGPLALARACSSLGARLIHVSTDYVFDGTATAPIPEDAVVAPQSAYGRTKAAGEAAVLATVGEMYVVRTSWVWGATGSNFVKTIIGLARSRDQLSVVDDQIGAPTHAVDLADGLIALGRSSVAPGIWNLTGSGSTTWFGFARAIVSSLDMDPAKVLPTTTDAFPRPAPRPAYSLLSLEKWLAAGLPPPRAWDDALVAASIASWPV